MLVALKEIVFHLKENVFIRKEGVVHLKLSVVHAEKKCRPCKRGLFMLKRWFHLESWFV
jgi:hypothetical protein